MSMQAAQHSIQGRRSDLNRASQVLQEVWGYDTFRPQQEDAILHVIQEHDSVVVLPTGGGKSLCYQVPALLHRGMAIVVSPLISLMKDQVDSLKTAGVDAALINSTLGPQAKLEIANRIRDNQIKILYLSPEKLLSPRTLDFLAAQDISFFAIDEAHCVSQWGHDFRPEYRQLHILKERFPNVSIHAFTATASEQVREDIAAQLGLRDHRMLVGNFDRPNLLYRMMRASDRTSQIMDVVNTHRGESGIVYAITRKEVEELSAMLLRNGVNAVPYHAGLDDVTRRENQDAFIKETVDVVVATVAFGMGIDKANVRYVIHAGMPKSIEHYQQESGRAGRDGLPADCVLIYSGGDLMTWKRILEKGDRSNFDNAMQSVNEMAQLCNGIRCRHAQLVEHFGQQFDVDNCNACDVCLGELELVADPVVLAQKILSSVLRQGERYGASYTAKVLRGASDHRVLQNGHDKLSTFGLLQDQSEHAIRTWIDQLASQDFLTRSGEYQTLRLTPSGREALRGEREVRLSKDHGKPKRSSKQTEVSWAGVDRSLFEQLRALRSRLASEEQVPAYVIFSDRVLRQLAAARPSKMESIASLQGIGAKKLAAFGEIFFDELDRFCTEHSLSRDRSIAQEMTTEASVRKRPRAAEEAAALFAQDKTIQQVADALDRALSTVHGYLQHYLLDQGITDAGPWVTTGEISTIETAINADPDNRQLKPIYDRLGEQVSFNDIRTVMNCMKNRKEMDSTNPPA